MARVHFGFFYRQADEYVVLHPGCPPDVHIAAAHGPVHAVGRTRINGYNVYGAGNAPVLFTVLRSNGHTICSKCTAECRRLRTEDLEQSDECPDAVFDDAWLGRIGMTRTETVSDWERIWDAVGDALKQQQAPSLDAHEQLLGLRPPYGRKDITLAFRKVALRSHPDLPGGGDEKLFKRACEARDALERATPPG